MYRNFRVEDYNVEFDGTAFDKGAEYQIVTIRRFRGDKETLKKHLYFLSRDSNGRRHFEVPSFRTKPEIEKYIHFANNSKLVIQKKLSIQTR